MLMVVRRLCGQPATGPSEVVDQSIDRIKRPISPPPFQKGRRVRSGGDLVTAIHGRLTSGVGTTPRFCGGQRSSASFCTTRLCTDQRWRLPMQNHSCEVLCGTVGHKTPFSVATRPVRGLS